MYCLQWTLWTSGVLITIHPAKVRRMMIKEVLCSIYLKCSAFHNSLKCFRALIIIIIPVLNWSKRSKSEFRPAHVCSEKLYWLRQRNVDLDENCSSSRVCIPSYSFLCVHPVPVYKILISIIENVVEIKLFFWHCTTTYTFVTYRNRFVIYVRLFSAKNDNILHATQ